MNEELIRLDVREDLRQGREPFTRILETVGKLYHQQALLLVAPFEPVPLFSVLAKKGFAHESRQCDSGEWEVLFRHATQTQNSGINTQNPGPRTCDLEPGAQDVDARGLEPPQPMIKILEALSLLTAGQRLHARTDRRPLHLYAQLEARGFTGKTEELADGSFLTRITSNHSQK